MNKTQEVFILSNLHQNSTYDLENLGQPEKDRQCHERLKERVTARNSKDYDDMNQSLKLVQEVTSEYVL
jgi:hypothetical protein